MHRFLLVSLLFVLEIVANSTLQLQNKINDNASHTIDSQYELVLPNGDIVEASFWPNRSGKSLGQVKFHEQRIIGGREATPSDAPYQVGIFKKGSGLHCGGTLINRNTVLTAAHCFSGTNIDDFAFILGKVDLRKPELTDFLTTASGYIIHPDYDGPYFTTDAAIVKLKNPICFNQNTKPLRLPTVDTPKPSGKMQISGWGYTGKRISGEKSNDPKYYASYLKVTDINLVPEDVCMEKLEVATGGPEVHYTIKHPSTFCAGVSSGSDDNCQGDSGGPVACTDENGSQYLCGIVSAGFGCGQPDTPALYAKVSNLMDWVKKFDMEDCE